MPTLKAATTAAGAAGAAAVAHLLRPLILDILKANAQGRSYNFTNDDIILCLMSFFQRAFLCHRRPKGASSGAGADLPEDQGDCDGEDDSPTVLCDAVGGLTPEADETPGVAMKFSWYNSVNAGWSLICWALLTERATVSRIGRGTFLLAMQGQSDTNRRELANAGIKDSDDFNIAYDRWNRIKPPC